jgi:hypothetical protein
MLTNIQFKIHVFPPIKNVKFKIHKLVVLSVIFYGRATWCLPLREELSVRVFAKRALKRIFEPGVEEVAGG